MKPPSRISELDTDQKHIASKWYNANLRDKICIYFFYLMFMTLPIAYLTSQS